MLPVVVVVFCLAASALLSEGQIAKKDKATPSGTYLIDGDKKYADCQERWRDGEIIPGVYTIHPNGTHPVKVYCNHSVDYTYTVMQQRYYGTESFNKGWAAYKHGFGHSAQDYWMGLDHISTLTMSYNYNIQIDMTDWAGVTKTIYLLGFMVQPESSHYRMTFKGYQGDLPNDLIGNNGMYFRTPDYPDQYQCAIHQKCGWWFNGAQQCTLALLNGVHYNKGPYNPQQYYDGIYYKDWHGFDYSMKYVKMSLYR